MKHSEDSHFNWKIGLMIGVAVLVIAGVTLGLIFGLGGGKNVEGIYVWHSDMREDITSYSSKTVDFTLILKSDKGVESKSSTGGKVFDGTYTVKDNKVSISWAANNSSVSDDYTIVDGNLVDEQSNVYIKQ